MLDDCSYKEVKNLRFHFSNNALYKPTLLGLQATNIIKQFYYTPAQNIIVAKLKNLFGS